MKAELSIYPSCIEFLSSVPRGNQDQERSLRSKIYAIASEIEASSDVKLYVEPGFSFGDKTSAYISVHNPSPKGPTQAYEMRVLQMLICSSSSFHGFIIE